MIKTQFGYSTLPEYIHSSQWSHREEVIIKQCYCLFFLLLHWRISEDYQQESWFSAFRDSLQASFRPWGRRKEYIIKIYIIKKRKKRKKRKKTRGGPVASGLNHTSCSSRMAAENTLWGAFLDRRKVYRVSSNFIRNPRVLGVFAVRDDSLGNEVCTPSCQNNTVAWKMRPCKLLWLSPFAQGVKSQSSRFNSSFWH